MSVYQNLVLTLTSLMEVVLKLTLHFQPKDKHCKFSYAMMTLKQPIPLAPNVEFPKLAVFIRNLPPKFILVLNSIHLVSLFHMQTLHKYGFDVTLETLINGIKALESQGLGLPFEEQVYGTTSQITGDNL